MPFHVHVYIIMAAILKMADGHGRLVEPPSRSTMWRAGYSNPPNYNDNQLFCGGFALQFLKNDGKCGVCGDPFGGPYDNEGPDGIYAKNGIIVRQYQVGQIIETSVEITANHKGYFQYKLCQNDVVAAKVTHECFNEHVLTDEEGNTQLVIGDRPDTYKHRLKLPPGLTCKACVLQWRYNTGNSWGTDPLTGKGCIGCGNQEQFYGCADIAIGENVDNSYTTPQSPNNGQSSTTVHTGEKPCNCPCSGSVPVSVSFRAMFLSLVFVCVKWCLV